MNASNSGGVVAILHKDKFILRDLTTIADVKPPSVSTFNTFYFFKSNIIQNTSNTEGVNPPLVNPPLVIQDYTFTRNGKSITVHVIRDDLLIGGTKQRGLYSFLSKNSATEFVYAGPPNGYAQLALAYCCFLQKKKATIFLSGDISNISKKAIEYGATIIAKRKPLEVMQKEAQDYCVQAAPAVSRYLIPFGLDSPEYIQDLAEALTAAAAAAIPR